ncbi:MAG: RluA family pseudouridine synthase [Acidimicrobiales bacterium]
MARLEIDVPASLEGVRVDRAISLLTDQSRSSALALVAAGGVHLDGGVVRRGSRVLRNGQRLVVDDVAETARAPGPVADDSVTFGVVFADDAVVVVDKPAGLVVHPGAGHRHGTLVHGLLARFPELADLRGGAGADPDRPGIVHRLDQGTSGLLVVARTAAAYDGLVDQLANRRVGRLYRALVHGAVDSPRGVVDAPVGRSPRAPTRMAVTRRGRPARTHYEVERRVDSTPPASLLRVSLETGRTHQIRVHMAAIGHPVVGDEVYGRGRSWPYGEVGRPFLHAAELRFDHPVTAEPMTFTSELPADLRKVLATLGI